MKKEMDHNLQSLQPLMITNDLKLGKAQPKLLSTL